MFGFFFPAVFLNCQILLYILYKIPQGHYIKHTWEWLGCISDNSYSIHLFNWMYTVPLGFFLLSVTPATTVPGQADSASIKSPALPTQQAVTPVQAGTTTLATTVAPTSASPQSQLPHQTQAHMPTQSPTSLQVKTQGGTAQLKLQQSPQIISMSGLQQQVQVWLKWTTEPLVTVPKTDSLTNWMCYKTSVYLIWWYYEGKALNKYF